MSVVASLYAFYYVADTAKHGDYKNRRLSPEGLDREVVADHYP
jgi:hypothetical protein